MGPDALDGGEVTFGKFKSLPPASLRRGFAPGLPFVLRTASVAAMNCSPPCRVRRRKPATSYFLNFGQHRVMRSGEFVRVHHGAHAEQTWIAGL